MAFGTAGLRGPMRAGFDSMNDLVIVQTGQGLVKYVKECYPDEVDQKRGIVLSYDGRHNSKRWASQSVKFSDSHRLSLLDLRSLPPRSSSTKTFQFTSSAKWLPRLLFPTALQNLTLSAASWLQLHTIQRRTMATRSTGPTALKSYRRMTRISRAVF